MPKSLWQVISDLAGVGADEVSTWTIDDICTHARAMLQLVQEHGTSALVHLDDAATVTQVDSAETQRLADKLRHMESEQQRLRQDNEALLAKTEQAIDPAEMERQVQSRIRARELSDIAQVTAIKREKDALESQLQAMAQQNKSLQQAQIEQQTRLDQQSQELAAKSRELAGIVHDASLTVPVRKGNAFEEEFETFLRESVLDTCPEFDGYELTRTGGGAEAHAGDHLFALKSSRMLYELKAYGNKESGRDVPSEQVIKFKRDMDTKKVQRGVMISKYGRISLGDGEPIDGVKMDGNILYIANMVHQDESLVKNMLFWWTMELVRSPTSTRADDAPVDAMRHAVVKFQLLRKQNRDALKIMLKSEKVLIDSLNDDIAELAKYCGQRHVKPRAPPAEVRKRLRELPDTVAGETAPGGSEAQAGETKRARSAPESSPFLKMMQQASAASRARAAFEAAGE